MNTRKISLTTAMFLMTALVLATPAAAGDATGKTTPFVLQTAVLLDWVDGPIQQTGGGTISRDMLIVWDFTMSDPRATGIVTIHGEVSVCKTAHPTPCWGPGHGTWSMDTNADGQPEWQGVVHIMPQTDNFITKYTGDGAGINQGLKITMGDHDGVFTGEIFDPLAQ